MVDAQVAVVIARNSSFTYKVGHGGPRMSASSRVGERWAVQCVCELAVC